MASILASAPQAIAVDAVDAAVRLRVEVGEDRRGSLWIEVENGGSRRDIVDASCEDAISTMALIAAMVIEADPRDRLAAADWVSSSPPASELTPANPPPSAQPELVAVAPQRPPRAALPTPDRSFWSASGSLDLVAESAVGWLPGFGAAGGFELGSRATTQWGFAGRAELLATLTATKHGAYGDAKLRLLAARLSICARYRLSERWQLVPCATLDGGTLYAAGADVLDPEQTTMPWLGAGALLRARYDFERWGLEGTLGVKRLVRHDRFYFRPDSTVYEVAPFSVGVALGAHFRIF